MIRPEHKRFFLLVFTLSICLVGNAACQTAIEDSREWFTNRRQPPERIMTAAGVEPGMIIGEVGAGRGRFTVQLAARVGPTGKIYAEDIDRGSLDHLRDRCAKDGIKNVEIISGDVTNPHFPQASLELVFMILTYHHLAEPVALLKNLVPCLKPGATVVVVDPDPEKDSDRSGYESTSKEKIEREAGEAGFELLRVETFLERDNIFILQVKK